MVAIITSASVKGGFVLVRSQSEGGRHQIFVQSFHRNLHRFRGYTGRTPELGVFLQLVADR